MINTPSYEELYDYYNDNEMYPWTKFSLDGYLEPLDLVRIHVVKKTLSNLNLKSPTILDVGCGSGEFENIAIPFASKIEAIDISKTAIQVLKKRNKSEKVNYKVAPAEELPYKKNTFDAVFCFETLEHLRDPKLALKEILRVLKSDGLLFVSIPNWFAFDRLMNIKILSKLLLRMKRMIKGSKQSQISSHLHYLSPGSWENMFIQSGFKLHSSRPIYVFPYIPNLNGVFGIPKNIEKYLITKDSILKLQQKTEEVLCNYRPFHNLGQSHFWVLKR